MVRLPYEVPPFDEGQLQEILRIHPELLAIEQIEPIYAPAVCIGREVSTPAGPLDNLYVSPGGMLTIVETKLWKNPQARREVVVQVMDYAKELARLTYEDVERIAERYVHKFYPTSAGSGVFSLAAWVTERTGAPVEERDFVEAVSRCLNGGRFLLLIVGEGIRGSVEDLVEHVNRSPELRYNLSLVELGCYRLGEADWPLVIVPHVIARTAEIERAIVRIEVAPTLDASVRVTVTTPPAETSDEPARAAKPSGAGGERRVVPSAEEWKERLVAALGKPDADLVFAFIDDLKRLGAYADYTSASIVLRYQPRREDAEELFLVMIQRGAMLAGGWLIDQLRKGGLPERLAVEFWQDLRGVHPGLGLAAGKTRGYSDAVPLADLIPKLPLVAAAIEKLVRAVEAADGAV